MLGTKTAEQKAAEMDAKHGRSFDRFLEKQETKLLLSMIPEAQNPDVVKTALRSAFDAGVSSGAGEILGSMLEAMMSKPRE